MRLVHVSNLSVEKGTPVVLDAYKILRSRNAEVSLDLVGPIRSTQLADRVARLAASDSSVTHHGQCNTDEIYSVLERSDCFLFPSSYANEAEPLVVLEALANELAVVATRVGSLGEILPSEWLVERPDAFLIAETVERILFGESSHVRPLSRQIFESLRADGQLAQLLGL
ncbi:glycosyltransferase [Actinomycetospora chibensis]|uniref:Glycosyltransferase n=1 Tax=Actinomycetospora chibensis TaxID=663606 RepID=A0ABV9RIZ3_9PSEU|nr:glycosyltransferase [Actinomycetospora chibensis]MDD7927204.1 glycosyltransferase [Actinomycetospora chibensis]